MLGVAVSLEGAGLAGSSRDWRLGMRAYARRIKEVGSRCRETEESERTMRVRQLLEEAVNGFRVI